jgi:hypothetical protein
VKVSEPTVMADLMGTEIVFGVGRPFFNAKASELGGKAYKQGPRYGVIIGRYCHRNAMKYSIDDVKRTGRRTD